MQRYRDIGDEEYGTPVADVAGAALRMIKGLQNGVNGGLLSFGEKRSTLIRESRVLSL